MHAAFVEENQMADNKLCLGCHELGPQPSFPHGLNLAELEAIAERQTGIDETQNSGGIVLAAARSIMKPNDAVRTDLACITCHTEHKGQAADISVMSDGQCQACHRQTFDSFASGHPEFSTYPYDRRSRIVFDHVSHIGKHFRDEAVVGSAPVECKNCHMPADDGTAMLVKGFETTCAACHSAQIQGEGRATAKGIAVFNVPGLDVATLKERNAAIGHWPEFAEAQPSEIMHLLLSTDAEYVDAWLRLSDVDLLDLTEADDATIEAVSRLAWTTKNFYAELLTGGTAVLKSRFESALGRPLGPEDAAALAGLIPLAAVESAANEWFPGLLVEVRMYRRGEIVPMPQDDEEAAAGSAEQAESANGFDDTGSGDILGDSDLADGGGDSILGDLEDASEAEDDGILGDLSDAADEPDDGILGDLSDAADGSDDGILGDLSDAADGILGDLGDGADDGGLFGELDPSETGEGSDSANDASTIADPVSGEEWASVGGWYKDYFSLRYRPAGHADAFIKTWLDQSMAPADSITPAALAVFDDLAERGAPGVCTKCHSVDAVDGDEPGRIVNWMSKQVEPNLETFTHFSHAAHFSLLDQKGCLTCHTLDSEATFLKSFEDFDPTTYQSNFAPIDRTTCAQCHVEEIAGNGCVMCHNYHVGILPPAVASTLDMMNGIASEVPAN